MILGGIVVLILVVHVDDNFAVGKERCDQFGEDMNRMVPVKNLGELKWYSGCFCLLYTSPSPRDGLLSRMPSSA